MTRRYATTMTSVFGLRSFSSICQKAVDHLNRVLLIQRSRQASSTVSVRASYIIPREVARWQMQ